MDANETLVVALGALFAIVLVVTALAWRRMAAMSAGLPLWGFLKREGIAREDAADIASADTIKHGEMLCSLCGNRHECRVRLASGDGAAPPANCPNVRLLDSFGVGIDSGRK